MLEVAGSNDSLAPAVTALAFFLGLRVCGDPTRTLHSCVPWQDTGEEPQSMCPGLQGREGAWARSGAPL